ncbi:MAG: 3-isopropylmalate dehydrogenase [Candidatus Firestonebacteria bacterium]
MSKKYNIAVIPGDGTGPEVIREGVKVLTTAAKKYNIILNFTQYNFGGERYLKTGKTLDKKDLKEISKYDAIYLGAIGHPDVKPGILEHGILLALRFHFDQYINLRPVNLYPNVWTPLRDKGPSDIDFVVIRENTSGLYRGKGDVKNKGKKNEVVTQIMTYTRKEVDRCLKFAFEYTRNRNKNKKLTLCHKTNVLTYAGDLWLRAFEEMGKKFYPDIHRDYAHVDATTMWMVKNPEFFDVIVTENMFGDIITDLGAMIQGGMGIAAGGNINPTGISMFEPIGGSAPKYAGKNIINPLAAICAGGMMLEILGEKEAAKAIENAVVNVLTSGKIKSLSAGKMGLSTSEVGDFVVRRLI